ncbi:acyl carrier protein [Streptomyces sp. NPDC102384]|uniref:acyl carrier protein n=1 Tax=Streptomyces sp. NPDC102384 TaxID=3366166 RepID=UPI00381DCA91
MTATTANTTATTTATLTDRVAALIAEHFGLPEEELRSGVTFDELEIDSLVLVELGLILRKVMGIVLLEGELKPSHTLETAVEVIASKEAA